MYERLEAIVCGRVQMVMFRDFVRRKASRLGLTGEVTNLPNGTVRVIAEGSPAALQALLEELNRGSMLSRVAEVQVVWEKPRGVYRSFDITYK